MRLNYHFEDVACDVICSVSSHINSGWYEPHYHTEYCDIDYEYDVDIDFEDFLDFMKPYGFEKLDKSFQDGFIKSLRNVWDSDWFDYDRLENDDNFIEFMTQKYEEAAREQCEKENHE